jgi:hypothetical protein
MKSSWRTDQKGILMTVFVGDDWAEAHHDIHVMNDVGERLAAKRLLEGLEGITAFHELVAGLVDDPSEVVVGIETERGMWVQALIAAGYTVYAINPLSVSRYRDRHNVAGAKSDPGDAKVLADLVRTDSHNHRPIAGDSDAAGAIKVLARAHQNLIWDRTRHRPDPGLAQTRRPATLPRPAGHRDPGRPTSPATRGPSGHHHSVRGHHPGLGRRHRWAQHPDHRSPAPTGRPF